MNRNLEQDASILSELLADLGYGLFAVDARGVLTMWSKSAASLTGWRASEVIGKPCGTLDGGRFCLAELLPWLRQADSLTHGLHGRLRARGKQSLPVHGIAKLVRDADGKVVGAVGAFANTEVVATQSAAIAPAPAGACAIAGIVGTSEAMCEVLRRVRLAARSDVTTMVLGESGTGKELVARALHDLSDRRAKPFVAVNCAALSGEMLESELFGHVKGAFTGADRDRAGLIESAHGGTLFLDEIGDVGAMTQVKLLRALQEREVRRLGSTQNIKFDVRLVTATNRDMAQLLADGLMREDFYYRIRVYEIAMPPLRERLSDIEPLVQWFVQQHNQANGRQLQGASHAALRKLLEYSWPGNVRELRNVIEHAFVSAEGERLELRDLPDHVRLAADASHATVRTPRSRSSGALWTPREMEERAQVLAELDRNDWNRSETANALGYSRVTLWKKMRKFGIDEGVFRRGG